MYTEATMQEDIAKYLAGKPLSEISRGRGISVETVRKMLQRNGIPRRKPGNTFKTYPDELLAAIVSEYQDGASQQSLKRKYGVDVRVISSLLNSVGVPVRMGGPPKQYTGGYENYAGYLMVQVPDDSLYVEMRNVNKYTPAHRLVMAEHLGRPLRSDETVHHKNGDRTDNRLDNLELRQGNHGRGVRFRCSCCGSHNVEPY